MIKKTISIDGSDVSYWVDNPQATKTVLIVHGFRGNHKALSDFAYSFKDQRVILLDLPGYGASEPMRRRHTLQNFAYFLESFIQHTKLEDFTLIGHSYGAAMCILYAAKRPKALKNLILICPAISTDGMASRLINAYYSCTYILPTKWQKSWLASPILDQIGGKLLIKKVSQRRRQELIMAGRRNLKEVRPEVVVESLLSYQKADICAAAAKIAAHTLIIAGALDQVVPIKRVEKLESCIKNCQLAISKEHGHLAPLEQPRHIGAIAQQFINY